MGLFRSGEIKVPRLDFELISGCDHRCGHCYNVWNARPGEPQGYYPRGQLETETYLAMMEKVVRESGAGQIIITGGEPLLRRDALKIIRSASELVPSVQLITNGSHVTPEIAAFLAEIQLRSVQLTLLSADREMHDRLKGAVCFDDTVRAAALLHAHRVPVQICYVAMKENAGAIEGVVDLAFALGAGAISYNRMSPTGWAVHQIDRLLPEISQVEHDLQILNERAPRYRLNVATAMPIPPCLIELEQYPQVQFGFCSVGTASPNVTVDPQGNIRSCNLSSNILGNILETHWRDIYPGKYVRNFDAELPEMCRGCKHKKTCRGGCKESAFAAYGALHEPEPFLRQRFEPTARASLRVIG